MASPLSYGFYLFCGYGYIFWRYFSCYSDVILCYVILLFLEVLEWVDIQDFFSFLPLAPHPISQHSHLFLLNSVPIRHGLFFLSPGCSEISPPIFVWSSAFFIFVVPIFYNFDSTLRVSPRYDFLKYKWALTHQFWGFLSFFRFSSCVPLVIICYLAWGKLLLISAALHAGLLWSPHKYMLAIWGFPLSRTASCHLVLSSFSSWEG